MAFLACEYCVLTIAVADSKFMHGKGFLCEKCYHELPCFNEEGTNSSESVDPCDCCERKNDKFDPDYKTCTVCKGYCCVNCLHQCIKCTRYSCTSCTFSDEKTGYDICENCAYHKHSDSSESDRENINDSKRHSI